MTMTKRFLALVLVLGLAVTAAMGCFAADTADIVVEYNGSDLSYSTTEGANMTGMAPGVESVYSFGLKNSSGASTNFYMSTEVIRTLAATGSTGDTGYTVTMLVDGQVIFGNNLTEESAAGTATLAEGDEDNGVLVGGQGTDELKVLNEADVLGNEYVLVATVAPNATSVLTLKITPNATGTDSTYRSSAGQMNFQFMAEEITPIIRTETREVKGETTIVTQTRYWLNGVQTGDPVAIAPLAAVLVLAVLVFILAAKKKKKKEE